MYSSNQDPLGLGFHLLQGFGDGNAEKECLTHGTACTWLLRAGDGSLTMAWLVPGAGPSEAALGFGASQSLRGASPKAVPLVDQHRHLLSLLWHLDDISYRYHQGSSLEREDQCVHGAAQPSLTAWPGGDVLRCFCLLCMLPMPHFPHYLHLLLGTGSSPGYMEKSGLPML